LQHLQAAERKADAVHLERGAVTHTSADCGGTA
jgi:hypothetical protein